MVIGVDEHFYLKPVPPADETSVTPGDVQAMSSISRSRPIATSVAGGGPSDG